MADLVTSIKTLQDDVTNLTTVDTSAVALISGLATQLAAALQTASNAGATPEQLQALADLHAAITKGSADLAAAVSANTPK